MLTIRRATADDCRQYWVWVNDPAVRAAAFHSDPIDWDTHVRWFHERLASADTALFVIGDATGTPIGQVRFDRVSGEDAIVDVSLDAAWRGRGLAAEALRVACTALGDGAAGRIVAEIREDNVASRRAFAAAGFVVDTLGAGRPGVVRLARRRSTDRSVKP